MSRKVVSDVDLPSYSVEAELHPCPYPKIKTTGKMFLLYRGGPLATYLTYPAYSLGKTALRHAKV